MNLEIFKKHSNATSVPITQQRNERPRYLLVLGFYSFLTVLFYYPVLGRFSDALIGPPEDNMQFFWFVWHGAEALARPDWELMHSRMIYYPEGMGLFYANYFYYGVFVASVLRFLLSYVQIFNLLVLSSFALSGVCAYALLKYLTGSRSSALVGGFVYAFNPSHFAHAQHHATIASIQWIPLFVLFYIKSRREGGVRNRLLAAVFLALSALCDWNYLLYGAVFLVLAYFYTALRRRRPVVISEIRNQAVIGLAAFAMLSAWIVPMLVLGVRHAGRTLYLPGIDMYVADLFGFFVPHPEHLLAQVPRIARLNHLMTGNDWEKTAYLGAVNLALVAVFFRRFRREGLVFLLGMAAFMLLSMGVSPHVAGHSLGLPLPYAVFEHVPLLKHSRNPSRIIVFAYLFLSVLAAFSFRHLLGALKGRALKRAVFAVLALLLFLDFYSVAREVTPAVLPPCYEAVKEDAASGEKPFAVLEIPWDGGRYLMYQTLHGLPILQGYVARKFGTSLIGRIPFDFEKLGIQRKLLAAHKVKYIVVHKKRLNFDPESPESVKYNQAVSRIARIYAMHYPKVYEDDGAATFRVYE